MTELRNLTAGMAIPYGGNRVAYVGEELAAAFEPGDHLVVVQSRGELLRIPAADLAAARRAVDRAAGAFAQLSGVDEVAVSSFFERFADRLADDDVFAPIAEANRADVKDAADRARSTTRLELDERTRTGMVEGLRGWARRRSCLGDVVEAVQHDGWTVERIRAGLGVVGFVFEGRPNVFADAAGVLRSGNTVVFRIGSDALATARAIVTRALDPALEESGLPAGAASLVDSPSRGAGHALFTDRRLALAVARGSGPATEQLGAVAAQSGIPVSLHGTGGAWIVADPTADADAFASAVEHSLDRKVCNTLNTCCIPEARADELVPRFLAALRRAADRRDTNPKLHVVAGQRHRVPEHWFADTLIDRAEGGVTEPGVETLDVAELGVEWEWENSPEVTLCIVESVAEAVELFNRYSPRFVATLIADEAAAHDRFYDAVDAPFVGNGFTRWVDGQYAFDRPELGLSNWERGRLLGRGGVLSGDSIFTIRTRARQADPDLRR